MIFVVVDSCIKCKYVDCVDVCPVDCFYEGPDMLVIHPSECVDCGKCEPECPVEATKSGNAPGVAKFLRLNAKFATIWPNIAKRPPELIRPSFDPAGRRSPLAKKRLR